ncbi:hypothetical protein BH11PLA1_BH11PLA1_06300 [soil metagenome]
MESGIRARKDALTSPPPRVRRPRRSLPRTALDEIEDTFLETLTPTLGRRFAAADFDAAQQEPHCPRCGRDTDAAPSFRGCARCSERRLPWSRLVRLGRYETDLRQGIRELKFHRSRAAGAVLGRLLGTQLAAHLRGAPYTKIVLVPIPSSRRRLFSRGIDHTAVLAAAVQRTLALALAERGAHRAPGSGGGSVAAVLTACLLTKRHRPTQTSLSATARAANMRGAFEVRRPLNLGPRGVLSALRNRLSPWRHLVAASTPVAHPPPRSAAILFIMVDDITTTNATLRNAARALRSELKRLNCQAAGLWAGVLAVTHPAAQRGDSDSGR